MGVFFFDLLSLIKAPHPLYHKEILNARDKGLVFLSWMWYTGRVCLFFLGGRWFSHYITLLW